MYFYGIRSVSLKWFEMVPLLTSNRPNISFKLGSNTVTTVNHIKRQHEVYVLCTRVLNHLKCLSICHYDVIKITLRLRQNPGISLLYNAHTYSKEKVEQNCIDFLGPFSSHGMKAILVDCATRNSVENV